MLRKIILAIFATAIGTINAQACTYKVGVVPQFEARRIHAVWTPLMEELSKATGCEFTLEGSVDIPEFETKFLNGAFDFAYMNPYHSVMAYDAQGYVPIVRSGNRQLQGILVVAADSDVTSVEQLDGTTIAFPSPNALGASLLMRAELATKEGINFSPKYVTTHSSVYLHVFKKITAAGGGVGRTLGEQPEALKDNLRIIYKTQQVAAHPLTAHPRVPEDVQSVVQSTFTGMEADLVKGIPMAEPIETGLDDYKILREMGLQEFAGK